MDTTLVVMAAGLGSRFGQGIKQLEPIGPNGEIIMDYSVFDARRAGFRKVVFIIRKDLEKDFKEIIGNRISKVMDVEYVFQEMNALPAGFCVPEGRKKPWGTGQAVLAAKEKVHEPFLVINADDYYGTESFGIVHDYMVSKMQPDAAKYDICMSGFVLKNTLSDNGAVTRGVCDVAPDGTLSDVTETFGIRMKDGKMEAEDENGNPREVKEDQFVSMNMWGLPPSFFTELEKGFPEFLKGIKPGDLKSEYLLPSIIDRSIKTGSGSVKVLPTRDRWFGLTYHEDIPGVRKAIADLIRQGVYPQKLYP